MKDRLHRSGHDSTMPAAGLAILSWICVSAVVTGKILDQDECGQGPEFWCQNLVTAIQCRKLEHCMQTVWKKKEGGNLCEDCKQLVTTFTNMMKESSLTDGIKNFLHNECNLLPVQSTVLQCQLIVDNYLDIVMTFLESQIADELNDFPIPLPTCWLCRFLIGRVEAAIPKDAIAKAVTQLCQLLPSTIGGMCQCITEKYTVILMDTILQKLGPQFICGFISLCATEDNYAPETPVISVPDKDIKCETCLTITALAKAAINENGSLIETEAVLHNICNTYHLDLPKCQKFMQDHQSDLLVVLKKNWDDHTTCQEIGVCSAIAGTALRAGDCTWGPAYWCSNMDAAKECNAVLHCQTHVWN
ncbi:pulmonary surfactant-associated protein B isoform X2 [Microcaecilia unicolor]|uniref:Pulmonary surfactant-associated protein B-like isoform X2 n=1 Tax=Microcaecilia unicolor TaxID=1415580 RepID=A0A6P7Y3E8_9AMPH|nr:pulmonary surfactant-associated protein B-like isoform X2 [Microcaecilia unicolor]